MPTTQKPDIPPRRNNSPNLIPFEPHEVPSDEPRRYNLRSQARHIIQSALDEGLVIPKDHLAFAVIDEETGKALEYRDLIKLEKYKNVWEMSYANELGRLTQGIRDIPGTNTMFFIHK